jgi:hypothetical protein
MCLEISEIWSQWSKYIILGRGKKQNQKETKYQYKCSDSTIQNGNGNTLLPSLQFSLFNYNDMLEASVLFPVGNR